MNKEVTNVLWRISCALADLKSCDQYDFAGDDSDDLDKLHSELEALYAKSDETIYDFEKMVDHLRVERCREEEAEDYKSESKHREYLNNWWHSTRM